MSGAEAQRERDRGRRVERGGGGERVSRFSDARDRSAVQEGGAGGGRRLFISNVPYDYHWTKLKDLFKEKVGSVAYVELFNDESGKSRGCGIVEFTSAEATQRAMEVMHRLEINGRKLVLKEDNGQNNERRTMGQNKGQGGGRGPRDDKDSFDSWPRNDMGDLDPERFNTYGLSTQFLDSINVQPPLAKKVFVANLDYKVDVPKIKEVFKLAGKVRNIELSTDKEGKSRGFAVIEYDHPVEAVQSISMFDKHMLYDRRMTVRMDRAGADKPTEIKLPEGLKSMGLGLGPNGDPLRDVARNIQHQQTAAQTASLSMPSSNTAFGSGILGAVPGAAASVALNGLGSGLGSSGLNANNALAGSLGLQALGLSGLGALQSQLLQQGLTANDLTANLANALTAQSALNLGQSGNMGRGSGDLGVGARGGGALANSVLAGNGTYNSGNLMNNSSQSSGSGYGQNAGMGGRNMGGSGGGGGDFGRSDNQSQLANSGKYSSDMVHVGNLPPTVTWQLLREKFSECGDVKFAEMTGSDTAIVRFHKEWDAQMAIKMFDRTRIDGRTIDVRFY